MLQTVSAGPNDEPFLFQVYASTRQAEVAAWGWAPAQQEAFLRMQFLAQKRSYEFQYPDADHRIILLDGRPVGRILVARSEHEIRLVDIALLPECRGAGIGSSLIQALQAEAAASGKPLRLHVLKLNPAGRLYERLGFAVTEEREMDCAMEWQAR